LARIRFLDEAEQAGLRNCHCNLWLAISENSPSHSTSRESRANTKLKFRVFCQVQTTRNLGSLNNSSLAAQARQLPSRLRFVSPMTPRSRQRESALTVQVLSNNQPPLVARCATRSRRQRTAAIVRPGPVKNRSRSRPASLTSITGCGIFRSWTKPYQDVASLSRIPVRCSTLSNHMTVRRSDVRAQTFAAAVH
jgi:hypothetical protein